MFSAVNLVAVCVADGLGILISLVLLLVKSTSLPGRKEEVRSHHAGYERIQGHK